jgi:hypothetical protein
MRHIKLFENFELQKVNESLDLDKSKSLIAKLCNNFKFKMMVDKNYEYPEIIQLVKKNGLSGVNGIVFLNGMAKKGDPDAWGNANNPLKSSCLYFTIVSSENGLLKRFYNEVMDKIESMYDTNDPESINKIKQIRIDRKSGANFRQLATNLDHTDRLSRKDKVAGSDQEERQRIKNLRKEQGGETYFLASVYLY